jgi:hypothetical protein
MKRRFFQEPRDVTSQKMTFLRVTAVKTSSLIRFRKISLLRVKQIFSRAFVVINRIRSRGFVLRLFLDGTQTPCPLVRKRTIPTERPPFSDGMQDIVVCKIDIVHFSSSSDFVLILRDLGKNCVKALARPLLTNRKMLYLLNMNLPPFLLCLRAATCKENGSVKAK